MSLPTENDISKALQYLAETDEQYAREIARVKALEHEVKTVKALAFLDADGTMAQKEAEAYASRNYIAWTEKYENAVADMHIRSAKRKRAELTIDVWRSLNANRRQGQT